MVYMLCTMYWLPGGFDLFLHGKPEMVAFRLSRSLQHLCIAKLIPPAISSLPYNHCVEVLMPEKQEMIETNLKHQVRSLQAQRLRYLKKTLAVNIPFGREVAPWTITKHVLRNFYQKRRPLQCKRVCVSGACHRDTLRVCIVILDGMCVKCP